MWIWIVVGVVVLAAAVYAFWPRAKGVVDSDAINLGRDAHGKSEEKYVSNRNTFPPW
jgi:hypothetical protein